MSPKKAIIIVLILFLVVAMVFTFLYLKKQMAVPSDGLNVNQVSEPSVNQKNNQTKPEATIEEKVNKVIEDAEINASSSPEAVRQEIISTINAEIIKQEASKTPEQKAADLKAQEDRQKIIDQINNQIRQKANTVK